MGVQSLSTRLLARQSDERLLELLVEGHERAFEAIVLRYRGELLRYCERLGLSEARAEDALQHALLKAWLALQGGTEVRELRAWLYRIVHNTAVNVMRSPSEERALDLDVALSEAVAAPESSLESATAAREALAHVAALPQMQRHVMLLSALEGRTHQEVASALGITDVAVRGLLYRARVTLRAAAATFTPAPLIGWCTQAASRVGARTGVAELTFGSGAPEAGGMLLKGAALAATAALAAGAVLGPLRGQHSSPAQAHAASPAKAIAGSSPEVARGVSSSHAPATLSPGSLTARSGAGPHSASAGSTRVSAGSGVSVPRRLQAVAAPRVAGPGGGGSVPVAASPASPAGSVPAKAVVAESPSGAPVGGGGSEGAGGPTPPPTGISGGGAGEPVGGGGSEGPTKGETPHSEHEEELAREKAENEREAAKERTEREAEATHEQAEREAEAAREQREREAQPARGGD